MCARQRDRRRRFRLAELLALCVEQQWEGHAVALIAGLFARKVDASDDIDLLVVAAHLECAAVFAVQVVEIVGLQQDVGEFRIGDGLIGVQHAAAHVFAVHKEADSEKLADVAQEFYEVELAKPVIVVDEDGAVGSAVEVEEVLELVCDAGDVVLDLLLREEIALRAFAGRVADAAGAAARDGDGPVAEPLQPGQSHDGNQVADVKAVGARVKTDVAGDHIVDKVFREFLVMAAPLDKTAFLEDLQRVSVHKNDLRIASISFPAQLHEPRFCTS